jgi:DNA-binding XRE family transcriptional regulator
MAKQGSLIRELVINVKSNDLSKTTTEAERLVKALVDAAEGGEMLKAEYEALAPEYEVKAQLIKLRKSSNLSQKDLAELAHTTQAHISRLENGNYNASIDFLKKIATAFGKEKFS